MAAKRDEWLSRAQAQRAEDVDDLLTTLRDTSVPGLERRLLSLTHFPRSPAIGDAAATFLNELPLKVAENLTLAAVAVGLVVVHGTRDVTLRRDVNVLPRLAPWRAQVVAALLKAVHRTRTTATHDLDARLAVLAEGPGTKVTSKAAALLEFPRDARIAEAAATLLERPPVKVDAANAYVTVAALLLSVHGGPAQRDVVRRLTAKLPQLSWLERALPDDDATASPKPSPQRTEADFLGFIAEDPSDDARVAAFADWLLERGDPRGDFIAQQRAGKAAATLQKKHEKRWLASLGRGARRGATVFRGGLPREVSLAMQQPADVPLADDPVLATIEAMEVVAYVPVDAFLASPMLKSLRTLVLAQKHLTLVGRDARLRLTTLGLRGDGQPLDALALTPNVTTLKLIDDWREPSTLRALPSRITALDAEAMFPAPWFTFAARVATLVVRPAHSRETAEGRRRVQFHFERGRLVRLHSAATPDEDELETFCFGPLATLTPAQRRGAVADVDFTPKQATRFAALCGSGST